MATGFKEDLGAYGHRIHTGEGVQQTSRLPLRVLRKIQNEGGCYWRHLKIYRKTTRKKRQGKKQRGREKVYHK